MTIKKLTFCILCSVNAANLATEEDFNDEISSNSKVEENILINKNNWNTRKWGSIYFLFPHLSGYNILSKIIGKDCFSFRGKTEEGWKKILNFIASGVIEYKYMFHKYCGINVRLNLNNTEVYSNNSFFSFEPSLEWIYGRKGKHIFSGSFSPWGFAIAQKDDGDLVDDFCKRCWTLGFVLLKYEYDRRFYLNFGKIKTTWNLLEHVGAPDFWIWFIGLNLVSIEFGLNIIGVNDWRKKRKENIEI